MSSLFFRHLTVLTAHELRDLFARRRAVVCMVLYALLGGLVVQQLVRAQQTMASLGVSGDRELQQGLRHILSFVTTYWGAAPAAAIQQLFDTPMALWAYQALSFLTLPTVASLVSGDAIAVDVQRGTLRFLLLRSSRSAYYCAKLLVHALLYIVLHSVGLLAVVGLSGWHLGQLDSGRWLPSTVRYLVTGAGLAVMLVAVTIAVSSVSRRPLTAILLLQLVWIAAWVLLAVVPMASPFYHPILLGTLAPFAGYLSTALLGYVGWTLGLLALGLIGFRRRNV